MLMVIPNLFRDLDFFSGVYLCATLKWADCQFANIRSIFLSLALFVIRLQEVK